MTRPHWHGKERDEALIRMANNGMSARQIIAKFDGKPTRSAIIGRVHRLQKMGIKVDLSAGKHGNSGPVGRVKPPKPAKPKKPAKPTIGWRSAGNAHHNDFKSRAEQRAASPGLSPALIAGEPIVVTKVVPISHRVPLVGLVAGICKWPQGDPKLPDFAFCGHDAPSGVYCGYHARIAYVPASERRRVAARKD